MGEEERKKDVVMKIGPKILDLLEKAGEIELEDVEININELEIQLPSTLGAIVAPPEKIIQKAKKPEAILEAAFTPYVQEYPGQIREITLGAGKRTGGSRGKVLKVGGEKSPAYYLFEKPPPNPPAIALDVFDVPPPLPKAIKVHLGDVLNDPAAWANLAVERFGADLVTIHLLSTDPLIKDAPPKIAAKTIENVLQTVDVPIIVGGCGDPKKDAEVFIEVAERFHGERLLLSSVTLDMDEAGVLSRVAKAAAEHDQLVLAFTALDLNRAKELNRKLYQYLPEDLILMDLTTAALGYGLEYSFTIHERARLAALMGDAELQHPTLSGTTNAWAAREAWLNIGPEWEPRELRGPLWETVTALCLLLAGVDIFMMMHPRAVSTVKKVIRELSNIGGAKPEKIANWVSANI